MPKKLTLAEQRALLNALPQHRMEALKKLVDAHPMSGSGFLQDVGSVIKKAGRALGPVVKEVGPVVLKEIIVPMLKAKYASGSGINPPGNGMSAKAINPPGGAIGLAGQRVVRRGRPKKCQCPDKPCPPSGSGAKKRGRPKKK